LALFGPIGRQNRHRPHAAETNEHDIVYLLAGRAVLLGFLKAHHCKVGKLSSVRHLANLLDGNLEIPRMERLPDDGLGFR
jgi:hypothetical protein